MPTKVVSPSAADLKPAVLSAWSDLEDHLIRSCAKQIRADYIITRDAKGFHLSEIQALSPDDFFEMLEQEHGIVYDEVDL